MDPPIRPTAEWLRARFATGASQNSGHSGNGNGNDDEDEIESGWPKRPGEPVVPAAVLIPLVQRETGLTVLLTQRTAHLRDHAGQISFPGGRCEASDASPQATALREAQEEVGLDPGQVDLLGLLPEYRTGTGFSITPVVALVRPPLNLKLDDFEVADVFEPPLEFLLDCSNHQRHKIEYQGAWREYYAMPWKGYFIWGATAGMLVVLRRFLFREN